MIFLGQKKKKAKPVPKRANQLFGEQWKIREYAKQNQNFISYGSLHKWMC